MRMLKACRKKVKIRMALQGPSGSGKTFSALLIAYGLCGDWNKIAVIDTENQSADLYSHLGSYNVLNITAPFAPEKYMEAIAFCEKSEISVIILDSISQEWEGIGGILDIHSKMTGNSFTNWSKLTPRHSAFIQSILQSPANIIATLRKKQDYVLTDKNGKAVPEKVGLKSIQREGTEYEFTLVFDLDIHRQATVSKDRTGLFIGKPDFIITPETGKTIKEWCQQGVDEPENSNDSTLHRRIDECQSVEELLSLYRLYPHKQALLMDAFSRKKRALQPIINTLNPSANGTAHK